VKLAICVLAILSPVMGWAQLAGDWAGVAVDSQGAHRIALHISGPYTAMKATANIPDQKVFNAPVESITFLESTLEFGIPASDARYSGVLNDNGSIAGTFTQHGTGMPLVLARVAPEPRTLPEPAGPGGVVENGRYHDTATGIEFDLPSGWFLLRNDPDPANPAGVRVFSDPSQKAIVFTANMFNRGIVAENIPNALAQAIPRQIAMRDGQTGNGPLHEAPNYKIREGSVDHTEIGGRQAIRAIGEFERNGKSFAELLAWVYTEHTRSYFMVRGAAEDLPLLQASFDRMMQSAKIP
jgi:hypothetical protein